MIYTFNGETIPLEKWRWVAVYKDDSTLEQFDDSGLFHQLQEVKRDELSVWRITDGSRSLDISMSSELEPIHFYRRTTSHAVGSDHKTHNTTYCFGYKDTRTDEQFIYMIYDNDQVVVTSDPNAVKNIGFFKDISR